MYTKRGHGKYLRLRDAMIQILLHHTGLRPGEGLPLRWTDIRWDDRMIDIDPMHNKQRNGMPAVIPDTAFEALKNYKKELEKMDVISPFLFPAVWTWAPLTTDSAGKRFRLLAEEAGINKIEFYTSDGQPRYNYHLYTHRKSFATKVYNETNDTLSVMKMIRNLTTSSIPQYVAFNEENRKQLANRIFDNKDAPFYHLMEMQREQREKIDHLVHLFEKLTLTFTKKPSPAQPLNTSTALT